MQTQVQKLTNRLKETRESRAKSQAYTKWEAERRRLVEGSPSPQVMEFWCDHHKCKKDFIALAFKKRNWGYDITNNVAYEVLPLRAWYIAKCERGHEVRRHITDKQSDPYFILSEKLKRERFLAGDDLLQPSDPRFKVVYPRQWEKLQAEIEAEKEKQAYMEYVEQGGY